MHARIDELLSLRDREPVAAPTAIHAAGCRACGSEIERLRGLRARLGTLPVLPAPDGAWEAVAARAYGRSRRHALTAVAGFGIAASAALLSWSLREAPPALPPPTMPPPVVTAQTTTVPATSAELIRRSIALETALKAMDYQPRVVRVSTAGTIADIEDRIALVDDQLNYAVDGSLSDAQSEQLWRQRVDLMGSLVQVRYAQARQAGY